MALIPEYHVVADMYPVGATAITAGMLVTLSSGLVVPAATNTDPDQKALGIAGDSKLTSAAQTTPYSDTVVLGADGAGTRWTENRVSDFYDETLASQKITVYNGGGKFWISYDLFDNDAANVAAGNLLKISGSTAGKWAESAGTDDDIVGLAVSAKTMYPMGVPGTDTDGHMSLGYYVNVVLRI
jgi:hypothetical protein